MAMKAARVGADGQPDLVACGSPLEASEQRNRGYQIGLTIGAKWVALFAQGTGVQPR
jgi:hypothetical protein